MGKTITFIALLLGIYNCVYGQSVVRSNVGSGGASQTVAANGKTYFISQSVGQASVIGTSSTKGYSIRQGFQQPPFDIILGKTLAEEGLLTTIYPNPFSQTVKIAFKTEIDEEVSVFLFDSSGRIILTKNYTPSQLITLSLENIGSGSYIMKVATGQRRMTTSLIKQ